MPPSPLDKDRPSRSLKEEDTTLPSVDTMEVTVSDYGNVHTTYNTHTTHTGTQLSMSRTKKRDWMLTLIYPSFFLDRVCFFLFKKTKQKRFGITLIDTPQLQQQQQQQQKDETNVSSETCVCFLKPKKQKKRNGSNQKKNITLEMEER